MGKEVRATLLSDEQYAKYLALDDGLRERFINKLLDEQPVDVQRVDAEEDDNEYVDIDGERRTPTIEDEATGLDTYDIINKEGKNNKDASVHAIIIDNYYLNLRVSFKYPPKDPQHPTKEEIVKAIMADESGRMLYIEDPKRGVSTVVLQDEQYNTLATSQLTNDGTKGLIVMGDFRMNLNFNASDKEVRRWWEQEMSKQKAAERQAEREANGEWRHPAERLASENFDSLSEKAIQEEHSRTVQRGM